MKYINKKDMTIFYPDGENEKLFAEGIYEEIFLQKIYGDVKDGDIVVDCGANIGLFAIDALQSNASKVICIDPNKEIIESFNANCGYAITEGKVVFYKNALWSESRLSLLLDHYYFCAGARISEETTKRYSIVETITIDDIVDRLNLPKIDLIKMDIEGSEENALLGAKKTIIKFKPRLALSLYHKIDSQQNIFDILQSFGLPFDHKIVFHKNPCPHRSESKSYLAVGYYSFYV